MAPPALGGAVDELALVDIDLADGRIGDIRPSGRQPPSEGIDLAGRMVLPGLVDMHTHLDKGHLWPRAPNRDGTFATALAQRGSIAPSHWHAADVRARMDFGLRCCLAHGTVAIRTHSTRCRRRRPFVAAVRRAAGGLARAASRCRR